MKSLITTILLITLISCTSNPAPTEEGVIEKDSVVVADTVVRAQVFKMSARVAVLSDEITISRAELGHLIDSIAAWKVASTQGQDYITMRKDIGFLVGEIDMLVTQNLILKDRLDSFHYVSFNKDQFDAIRGEQTDSVSLKKL